MGLKTAAKIINTFLIHLSSLTAVSLSALLTPLSAGTVGTSGTRRAAPWRQFTASVGWRCSVGLTYLLSNSDIITVFNTGRVLRAIGRFAFMLFQTTLSVPLSDGGIKYLCASD